MKTDTRDLSNILAGLRLGQERYTEFTRMPHFEGDDRPYSLDELDDLCERINIATSDDAYSTVVISQEAAVKP